MPGSVLSAYLLRGSFYLARLDNETVVSAFYWIEGMNKYLSLKMNDRYGDISREES